MPNHFAPDYTTKVVRAGNYGNGFNEDYAITAQPAAGDKLYLGVIPAGIRVTGLRLQFGAGGTGAAVTLGFEPQNAKNGPEAKADAFLANTAAATAGAAVANFDPVTFDFPVALVATVGAAAFGASTKLVAIVTGKQIGVR